MSPPAASPAPDAAAVPGRAWKVGANVSTDEILPGPYMSLTADADLARHALEGVSPAIAAGVRPGDVLVAGANFGTGSSRQGAPRALRAAGFAAIVAPSFARIFFRNCVNIGLPAVWSPEAAAAIADGHLVFVDATAGRIVDHTSGEEWQVAPLPAFVRSIAEAGGLAPYARARLAAGLPLVPR
jgi:3-isopropylmalate/(R)-2-methylmalate dehydratase small subunit